MGGYGSGRRGRRLTYDSCLRLDVRWLHRQGILGGAPEPSWRVLRWRKGEHQIGSIRVRASGDGLGLELAYATPDRQGGPWLPTREAVRLDHTPCHFGGARPWFLCPRCGRRCAVLVVPGPRACCRVCARLPYAVQREGPLARMRRRINKVEDRIPHGIRPRWMRHRTYWRLRARLDALEDVHSAELARALGPLRSATK